MSGDISIVIPVEDDWDEYARTLFGAFNEEPAEPTLALERLIWEPRRSLAARRDGQLVGTAGIFTRQLSVPGAVIPAGHVTFVSVAATARRQGVLTRMMQRMFTDMIAAGESIAVLWASEGRIYQRFGFGLAVRRFRLEIANREVSLLSAAPDAGQLRAGTVEQFRDTLVKVYDQAITQRVGWSQRAQRHWDYRLGDPPQWRDGSTSLRVLLHESDQGPDGYALYRTTHAWNDAGPDGEVRVVEVVATTPPAYLAIWRHLLSLDLIRKASYWHAAVDEPLQYLVNEPRQLGARMGDALWLRLLDLPAALSARRYAAGVDVVLEVSDPQLPANAGRWRLTASPGAGARCVASTEPPDLRCDIRVLGAVYLGGAALTSFADGGLVTEVTAGTLAQASMAFGWARPPSAIEVF